MSRTAAQMRVSQQSRVLERSQADMGAAREQAQGLARHHRGQVSILTENLATLRTRLADSVAESARNRASLTVAETNLAQARQDLQTAQATVAARNASLQTATESTGLMTDRRVDRRDGTDRRPLQTPRSSSDDHPRGDRATPRTPRPTGTTTRTRRSGLTNHGPTRARAETSAG